MQSNPLISVVVPVYNAEKYLDRCIKSIYSQTFSDYEIILVNDGSTDNSAELCRKYKAQDERITYIEKQNEGAGSARNAGIVAAKGEYLYFPDVDDWFEPNMLEELYSVAKQGNFDIVFSGANFYGTDDKGELIFSRSSLCEKLQYTTRDECRKNVMKFFPTSTIFDVPWNKLYKRSVAIENDVRFSDTRRCQDAMFNIDFYNAASSAASVNKAYYNYIENTSADVQRKFPKNYIDINFAYYNKLMDILKSWNMYYGDIKKHYDTSLVLAVFGSMQMLENPRWNLSKKEQKDYILGILARRDLRDFLRDADIRSDAQREATILRNKDYSGFMRFYRIEKFKEAVRNTFLIKIYRRLKAKK